MIKRLLIPAKSLIAGRNYIFRLPASRDCSVSSAVAAIHQYEVGFVLADFMEEEGKQIVDHFGRGFALKVRYCVDVFMSLRLTINHQTVLRHSVAKYSS
jgi:hypothetical protein